MRAWVSAVTVLLLAASASPVMACHACVVGQPCQGCPHEGDASGLVLILTATDGLEAQWLVKARRLPSLRRAPRLIGTLLSGRIRCTGRNCVGRRGRFRGSLAADQSLTSTSRFRAGATCDFSGPLQIGVPSITFRCVGTGGAPVSQGSARVTLCRGVGCVAPAP